MRRLWRYNNKLYIATTGFGISMFSMMFIFGYKMCFEVPMRQRLTKSAIRNGEVTGYYEALREEPLPKNSLTLHMI